MTMEVCCLNKVKNALRIATEAHSGVTRKYSTEPYVNHVIRVAFEVARLGLGDTLVAAALLHDTLEDTDLSPDVIVEHCGENVLSIVQQLTNPSHLPENAGKRRWERKQIDRDHLKQVSLEAKIIKLCDRIDNLRDVGTGPRDFQILYANESEFLWKEALVGINENLEKDLLFEINRLRGEQKG